jgi:hypothetical protein
MTGSGTIGEALARAIAHVREAVGDSTASVAVITPSRVNANFARRELAFAGPFIRVSFITPAQLHAQLAEPRLRQLGLTTEPPGWLRATLARLLRERSDLGPYGEAMTDKGWLPSLAAAIGVLEEALVSPEELRAVSADQDTGERAALLATLLEAVHAARTEDAFASPADIAKAAGHSIAENTPVPMNVHRGSVLLGDARNSRAVAKTLGAYLQSRPVARLELPHVADLPPATLGLTAAAPDADPIRVAPVTPETTLVRTPDPMREVVEAVRETQAAIEAGVPYDRIALVLPDPAEAVTLREALERAGIPATWQTGPSLSLTPSARFLLHALSLRAGEDTVTGWYELLRLPLLRLRANAGVKVARGRARWRRLLARCGAYRGTDTILAALDAYQIELAAETEDEERLQKDTEGFDSLRDAMRRFLHDLPTSEPKPLGQWARELRVLLQTWWPMSQDQRALDRMLESWSRSSAGPKVGAREAHVTFTEALDATTHLQGALKDPAIRVLSPMQLVGGRFDRVLVTGLTQGRFPRDPSPDPILTDALIDALPEDRGLFRSADRIPLERRRFAAIRSAAVGKLWCSVPAMDLSGGRPLLPGSLIMELASEASGERPSFRELEAILEPRGRRSRPFPEDPAIALGAAEFLIARLAGDQKEASLGALADHPWSRRLIQMHRALDRIAAGERSPELRPYAGFVRALPCQGLDGTPLTPRELEQLVDNPLSFFFKKMLGAWGPTALYESWKPDVAGNRLVREVAMDELATSGDLAERFAGAFEETFAAQAERAGFADGVVLERIRGQMLDRLQRLAGHGPSAGPVLELDSQPVTGDLPWKLSGGDARRVGSALQWIELKDKNLPRPRSKTRPAAAIYEATAHATAGAEVSELEFVGVPAKVGGSLSKHGGQAMEALALVTDLVRAELFAGSPPSGVRLKTDPSGTFKPEQGTETLEDWQ